ASRMLKKLSFSPTRPRRAKKHRSAGKAAASEDRRRPSSHLHPPKLPRRLVFQVEYVEDLNDSRTTHGKRRVSPRLGRADERATFSASCQRIISMSGRTGAQS